VRNIRSNINHKPTPLVGLRIFTNVLADRKANEKLYKKFEVGFIERSGNISRAMKATQKALDVGLSEKSPTHMLQENIMSLCNVQQKASEVENEINWVIKFYRKMDNSNLTDEYLKSIDDKAKDILSEMLACGRCVKASLPKATTSS
jgi:predicted ATP-grasp superfamily ATP-dependent carboligase